MVTAKELADASKKAFQGGNFSEANTLMQQVRVAVSDRLGPNVTLQQGGDGTLFLVRDLGGGKGEAEEI
jgi:hypothetical protein